MEDATVIRDFCINDLNDVINLLQQGYPLIKEEALEEFNKNYMKAFVYEDTKIKGFALTSLDNPNERHCKIILYVDKSFRHKGIGKKLHDVTFNYAKKFFNAKTISISFMTCKDDPSLFFKSLNYEKWFIYHNMEYKGKLQPNPNLPFMLYDDKYFENLETLSGEAFYNLRKANDIKPYNCSDFSDECRKNHILNKNNTYILLDTKGEIISSITIKNGILDNIMVNQKYKGQGYGCKTTQFGINTAINQGFKHIKLSALDWNKRAINIYEALGFKISQTFHNYRQQIK